MKRSGIPACDVSSKTEVEIVDILFAGIPLSFIPAYKVVLPSLCVGIPLCLIPTLRLIYMFFLQPPLPLEKPPRY